jgi:hypothetical protein
MAPARWSSDKWNVTRVGEDTIPTVGCSVAVLLSAGLITARTRDGNLSPPLEQALHLLLGAYAEDVLQLTVHLATPSVEGMRRVSKSDVATTTFWLALAKVGCNVP